MVPFIIAVAVISVIGGIIVGIVTLMKGKKGENRFTFMNLWSAYLYFMTLISLIGALIGGAMFLKSALTNVFGPQFSYQMNYYDPANSNGPDGKPVPFDQSFYKNQTIVVKDGKTFYFDGELKRTDMVEGLTIFLSLGLIFALHKYLSMKLEGEVVDAFKKLYLFLGLIITSIISIILIPTAIYQLISYFVYGWTNVSNGFSTTYFPGEAIAGMILFVPTWIIFIFKMFKMNKPEGVKSNVIIKTTVKSKRKVTKRKK